MIKYSIRVSGAGPSVGEIIKSMGRVSSARTHPGLPQPPGKAKGNSAHEIRMRAFYQNMGSKSLLG